MSQVKPTITIVIVDEDAGMNRALKRLLHAAGFSAKAYASAEAFLKGGAPSSMVR